MGGSFELSLRLVLVRRLIFDTKRISLPLYYGGRDFYGCMDSEWRTRRYFSMGMPGSVHMESDFTDERPVTGLAAK